MISRLALTRCIDGLQHVGFSKTCPAASCLMHNGSRTKSSLMRCREGVQEQQRCKTGGSNKKNTFIFSPYIGCFGQHFHFADFEPLMKHAPNSLCAAHSDADGTA